MKAVLVEWEDATAMPHGWHDIDEAHNPVAPLMRSIGWLVHEDEDRIVICLDHDEAHSAYAGAAIIPRGCVRSIKEIEI